MCFVIMGHQKLLTYDPSMIPRESFKPANVRPNLTSQRAEHPAPSSTANARRCALQDRLHLGCSVVHALQKLEHGTTSFIMLSTTTNMFLRYTIPKFLRYDELMVHQVFLVVHQLFFY